MYVPSTAWLIIHTTILLHVTKITVKPMADIFSVLIPCGLFDERDFRASRNLCKWNPPARNRFPYHISVCDSHFLSPFSFPSFPIYFAMHTDFRSLSLYFFLSFIHSLMMMTKSTTMKMTVKPATLIIRKLVVVQSDDGS